MRVFGPGANGQLKTLFKNVNEASINHSLLGLMHDSQCFAKFITRFEALFAPCFVYRAFGASIIRDRGNAHFDLFQLTSGAKVPY
ncbi:hypothetical protein EYZ11_013263 [Aspergillus tanneri]|uniref:Uncharacterized protein n=1 Tax=Aspergillus tanneri TaxID=1220188 RepID=A0A4S3J0A9_9EURO|nr:hypothetical protein EYZ11_013263 [Aspergillus tanneri]